MPRPRRFDRDDVLRRAMRLFWEKGFEAASLADVLAATGLSKSSLYDTFGDKRTLFLEALRLYRGERAAALSAALNDGRPARASIVRFFETVAAGRRGPDGRLGCMMCNEAIELSPHDPHVRRMVTADFRATVEAFAAAVARGHADGSIARTHDARQLACFLTSSLQGLQVLRRGGAEAAISSDAVAVIVTMLDTTR